MSGYLLEFLLPVTEPQPLDKSAFIKHVKQCPLIPPLLHLPQSSADLDLEFCFSSHLCQLWLIPD